MAKTWSSPLPAGSRTGSNFGPRSGVFHAGDDFPPPSPGEQGVPVYAIASGTVIGAGVGVLKGHSGKVVVIDHGGGVVSNYGHLASIAVTEGDKVTAGQRIGVMGYTGNVKPAGKAGTHLHLGIRVNGKFVDPSVFLAARSVTIGKSAPVAIAKPKPKAPTTKRYTSVQQGSRSAVVGRVQRALRGHGYTRQIVDEIYGSQTEANVRDWQRRHGLKQDGIAGPITQKSLGL